ncbi:MAG: metallopeptidase family protein [Candidatus Brocadia sp.]|nr:metallopeptidase family protein [Candidatus Brocadia sp.]
MEKNPELLKCFHCGKVFHPDEYSQNRSMKCFGCGMELVPLIAGKIIFRNTKGFYVLLGFFTIIALLGAIGGVMLVHGWNFWVTFAMVGGIIFFISKIFMSKYKISEIGEYLSSETVPKDHGIQHGAVFDQFVIDAINDLPQKLKDRLSNVSVVVEDKPNRYVLEKLRLMSNTTLLGLFQGVPLSKKSVWQSGTMPERITLFQKNIEKICCSDEEIKQRIKEVIRHEVAHFVGFTEEEIRKLGY